MQPRWKPAKRCEHVSGGIRCLKNATFKAGTDPGVLICASHRAQYKDQVIERLYGQEASTGTKRFVPEDS